MARRKNRIPDNYQAYDSFNVFIKRGSLQWAKSKETLLKALADPDVYTIFLKLCLEDDKTKTLVKFRKGLLLVLKSIGISKISKKTGLSRVSIYRMLAKDGNPEFKSILALLSAIEMKFWAVSFEDSERSLRATEINFGPIFDWMENRGIK